MHNEARRYVAKFGTKEAVSVLECGARDVNGTVRDLFPNAKWFGVDIEPGWGVDHVGDFADYRHPEPVDVVICCEVYEHTANWRDLIRAAAMNLRDDGLFVCTAAGPGRDPHSAVDGGRVRHGEWYENIVPEELNATLAVWFQSWQANTEGPDVQGWAIK